MNNIQLETKINLGIKLLGLVIVVLMLHSVSSMLNNLGILTDLFIVIGVYQSGKFLTNKELRNATINKTKEIVDISSLDDFVNSTMTVVNNFTKEETNDVEPDFKFSMDDLLNPNPITSREDNAKPLHNKPELKVRIEKTYDASTQFNGINKN